MKLNRQLSYGYPLGQTVHIAEATTQDIHFSIYYMKTSIKSINKYDVNANLDASDNVILGNNRSSDMLTSQSKK